MTSVIEEEQMEAEISHKKVRHRKKQFHQTIRKYMEFYFSDSNLAKDRFLGKLFLENPAIDISIFLKFNKIRSLTTEISDIVKALRNSEFLSVTEDGTQVFRTTPIVPLENAEDCTIYVEQLPPDAQHEWLIEVFSAYGKVTYVSIPRFKSSRKIKGFAFVEFQTPEEANKALEAFAAMGCHLSTQIAPEKLCSIATYAADENKAEPVASEENKQHTSQEMENQEQEKFSKKKKMKNKGKLTQTEESNNEENETAEPEDYAENISRRKLQKTKKIEGEKETEEEADLIEESPPKKKKNNETENGDNVSIDKNGSVEQESETAEAHSEKKKRKRKIEYVENLDDTENNTEVQFEKKKRKVSHENILESDEDNEKDSDNQTSEMLEHSEKKSVDENSEQPIEERGDEKECCQNETIEETGEEMEVVQGAHKKRRKRKKKHRGEKQDTGASRLRILSKKEWKHLRNKYLDLQKNKMKCLKHYLSKNTWNRTPASYQNQGRIQATDVQTQGKGEAIETNVEGDKGEAVSKPRVSFTPGVIVHAILDEPVMDIRKFKADARSLRDVEYVDVLVGANEAYIRCATPAAAESLVSTTPWHQTILLSGDEEKKYWEKIFEDRKWKFSNNIQVKQRQRGRDKVLQRAERELGKHIRFDD